MTARWICLTVLLCHLWLQGCGGRPGGPDPAVHRREVEEWRRARLSLLTSESGWLTVCGLFWLKEGPNTCGDDPSLDVVLPRGKSPGILGTFWRTDSLVRFAARPGGEVHHEGALVTSLELKSDADQGGPSVLTHGTLSFYVIKRGDKLGVRVKDKENPTRANFKGLEYFPIRLAWRHEATFTPYNPPRVIKIANAVNIVQDYSSPGALTFEHEGKTYTLDALAESGEAKELLIMFSDQTAGFETYGGGRQLYTGMPDAHGKVVLDFNKAYNWPCVFTEFATCPIPPAQNHLPLRVEAGEKMYAGHE